MGSILGLAAIVVSGIGIASCATVPRTAEQGAIEIGKVRDAIDCELVAVATNPDLAKYRFSDWGVKSSLDLTVVGKIGVDGKAIWVIPHSPMPTTAVTPTLSVGATRKSIAEIDFSTDINKAIPEYDDICRPGPDPSETGFGLAAWIESTLLTVEKERHGGMTYTSEFEISGAAGARFGYVIQRLTTDSGLTASRTGTHRLTVAVAPPPPPPGKPKPIPVYIVPQQEGLSPDAAPERRRIDNPTLDRLLQRQAPIRLEPQ